MVTTYKDSGVDIDAQDEALREVRRIVRGTFTPGVLSDIGSFGGLFRGTFAKASPIRSWSLRRTASARSPRRAGDEDPRHGRLRLVSHCVNDILVQGARPLFFLDTTATGKLRRR
jgi:phosphoribosylformylglycinamidine cyclo-ligase